MPPFDTFHATGTSVKHGLRCVALGVTLTMFGGCASKDGGPARMTDTSRLTDAGDPRPGATTPRTRSSCQQPGSGPLQVSTETIGGLPLEESLRQLKVRCPLPTAARFDSFESTGPGLAFPFDSIKLIGFQHGAKLDLLKPAVGWEVTGCGARLPRGVSTCARWSELIAAYGDSGTGNTEFGPAVVHLRALPGYSFELNVTDSVVGSLETQSDLSRIPGNARLVRIRIAGRESEGVP